MADPATPRTDGDGSRRILEERARALARPLRVEEPVDSVGMIVMAVGQERYAVDEHRVREVVAGVPLTPVPGTAAFWSGIANVRGTLYPVLDLRRYLSLAGECADEGPRSVVLVTGAGLTVGLLVDDAPEVRRLPAAAIGPPLTAPPETGHRVVRGVTKDLLTVLDVEALLADTRLAAREDPHEDPA